MKTNELPIARKLGRIAGLVIVCQLFIIVITINTVPFFDGRNDLMDFGSFYASGLKLQNGENPYDPNSAYIFDIFFERVGAGGKMMNLNPPISAVIFQILTRFEPQQSMIVWQIISALLYLLVVWMLTSAYKDHIKPGFVLWAITLAGFWHTLVLGQIYILLLLFATLGWILLRRGRYILAGLSIGLVVAVKPNFILWPLFMLVSGYTITSIASLISCVAITIIPVLVYGTKIYSQWLGASAIHPETLIMPGNNSILGLTTRFQGLTSGIIVSIMVVITLLVLSRLKSPIHMQPIEYISALGIIASLLASPISWTGYTILLLPIYFSLRRWTPLIVISAVILAIPFQIVLQLFQNSFFNFVFWGWLYGWGILLLSIEVVRNTMMTNNIQTNWSTSSMKL
jgi:hypothetical protein